MPRAGSRPKRQSPDHIVKARLVEEIASLLHAREGVEVERNVRLPSLSDSSHIREIDVLVTGNVAGYPVRIPIECKNYSKRISAGQIGEFKDKLEDVGLSVRDSVYISVVGFGRDARRRASDHGIKLFELKGLTADRLSSVVHKAFQSTTYLLLCVERITLRSELDQDEIWSVMWIKDRRGNIRGGLFDIIWEKWTKGQIPDFWGEQELVIVPPDGWSWHIDDPNHPRSVTVSLKVLGIVLTTTGEAYRHVLKDILEQKFDRSHIRAIFRDSPGAIKLTIVESEAEFNAATRPGGIANIVFGSEHAPRIQILRKLYWPPTERSVAVVKKQVDALIAAGKPNWDTLQELTFEELEGTDVGAIWGKTWEGHPSSRGEDWPVKYSTRKSRSGRVAAVRRRNPKRRRR